MGCGASSEEPTTTQQNDSRKPTNHSSSNHHHGSSALESSMAADGTRGKDGRIKHTTLYPEEARMTDVVAKTDDDSNRKPSSSPQPQPVSVASVEPTQHTAATSLNQPQTAPSTTTTNIVVDPVPPRNPSPMPMQPAALQQPSHGGGGDYHNNLSSTSFSVQGTQSSVFAPQSPNVNGPSPLHPPQAPPPIAPLSPNPVGGIYHQPVPPSNTAEQQYPHRSDETSQLQPLGGAGPVVAGGSMAATSFNGAPSGVYHTSPPPAQQPSPSSSTPHYSTNPPPQPSPPPQKEEEKKKGFFGSIGDKLSNAKNTVTTSISNVLPGKRLSNSAAMTRQSLYVSTIDKLVFLHVDNQLRQISSDTIFKALFLGSSGGLNDTEGMQTFSAGAGGIGGTPPFPVGAPLSLNTHILVINQTPQQFYLVDEPYLGAQAVVRHLTSSTMSKLGFDPSLARPTTAQEMQQRYQIGSSVI